MEKNAKQDEAHRIGKPSRLTRQFILFLDGHSQCRSEVSTEKDVSELRHRRLLIVGDDYITNHARGLPCVGPGPTSGVTVTNASLMRLCWLGCKDHHVRLWAG